jgi:sugar phosphate isomerase/epimerase
MKRKDFIALTALSTLCVPFLGSCDSRVSSKKKEKKLNHELVRNTTDLYSETIGLQVFQFREQLKTSDVSFLYRSFAEAGVKTIEFFNTPSLNIDVPIVKDCGMIPLATHFMPGYITGRWETAARMNMKPPDGYLFEHLVEDCVKNEIKYMGIANIMRPEDAEVLDDYKHFAEKTNKCAELSKSAGIQLYYHNHAFEFERMGGSTPYEAMLSIFDKDLVKLEVDVFWSTVAGYEPIKFMNDVSDWLLFLHMKDLKQMPDKGNNTVPQDYFVELGTGILDWKSILSEARKLGVEYVIIDQDRTQMEDKMASLKMNCDYVRSLGI